MELTKAVSAHLKSKFISKLGHQGNITQTSLLISTHLAADCERAANVLVSAYQYPSSTEWDVRRYTDHLSPRADGMNQVLETELLSKFPPIHNPPKFINVPTIFVDRSKNILAWYLPDILSIERQASAPSDECSRSMHTLQGLLRKGIDKNKKSSNWRSDPKYFNMSDDCFPEPGVANISPAWFQQGHAAPEFSLEVSLPLKSGKSGNSWMAWLESVKELHALIGGILSIVHPDLFDVSMMAFENLSNDHTKVQEHDRYLEILQYWLSGFTGMSIISNRESPKHRDVQGRHSWYDILATFGQYSNGRMELPSLGVRLEYNPGTLVALAGKTVPHGVASCTGDRVCLAYFMRDNVHERARVPTVSWMNMAMYKQSE